jgi:hypothetical protein
VVWVANESLMFIRVEEVNCKYTEPYQAYGDEGAFANSARTKKKKTVLQQWFTGPFEHA